MPFNTPKRVLRRKATAAEAIHIRKALTGEAGAVSALVNAAYARYIDRMGKPPAPMLADYDALVAAGVVYVLPGEHEPRAAVVMMPDADGLFLENIAVRPDCQGQGLGRELMDFVETSAREQCLPAVHLYTNEVMIENLAFYTRLGFEEMDRREEDGYRRVFFRKILADTAGP